MSKKFDTGITELRAHVTSAAAIAKESPTLENLAKARREFNLRVIAIFTGKCYGKKDSFWDKMWKTSVPEGDDEAEIVVEIERFERDVEAVYAGKPAVAGAAASSDGYIDPEEGEDDSKVSDVIIGTELKKLSSKEYAALLKKVSRRKISTSEFLYIRAYAKKLFKTNRRIWKGVIAGVIIGGVVGGSVYAYNKINKDYDDTDDFDDDDVNIMDDEDISIEIDDSIPVVEIE